MPLTPFIGLSIFFHIVLILIFKIFNIHPVIWHKASLYKTSSMWLGSIIIVAVFSFVIFSAGLLLYASITDKHSSILYIHHHWPAFRNGVHYQVQRAEMYFRHY